MPASRTDGRPRRHQPGAIVALSISLLVASCRTGNDLPASRLPAPERSQYAYVIAPGDQLRVDVRGDQELSRDVSVGHDGRIALPLIGHVKAAGCTVEDLEEIIIERYGKFREDPQITVGVVEAHSAVFYVLGKVKTPGKYPLIGRTTVLQAIAAAGGFSEWADTGSVAVIRQIGDGTQAHALVDMDRIADGTDLSLNVELQPGDTVLVP